MEIVDLTKADQSVLDIVSAAESDPVFLKEGTELKAVVLKMEAIERLTAKAHRRASPDEVEKAMNEVFARFDGSLRRLKD